MENLKKILKYKKEILLFCFVFISIFFTIIVKPIADLDELWNYNAARAISMGLIPYKDISMITTPLLPIIASVFLKVIANEVIVTRILASLIGTTIIIYIYKIFSKLLKEENITLIATALIGILFRNIYALDYNLLVVLLALIILYSEIKMHEKDEKQINYFKHLLIGLLAGLAFCTKQSTGAILSMCVLLVPVLEINNKEEIKEKFKIALTRILGIIILICIFIVYLILTQSYMDFINYAVLGISTFTNKIPYKELFYGDELVIKLLAVVVPVTILILGIKIIINSIKQKNAIKGNNLILLFVYSISIIITMYPITDNVHFLEGSTITIISLIYLIFLVGNLLYNKISYNEKKFLYKVTSFLFWLILLIVIILFDIENAIKYIKAEKNMEINHYRNIEIQSYLKERIHVVDDFIIKEEAEGKNVYILDAEAVGYMIPLDKYNKNYDLFLKGNLGKDGEEGEIAKIQNREENTVYLIRNASISLNWQTPKKVIEYIRENLQKIGQVSMYDIYE